MQHGLRVQGGTPGVVAVAGNEVEVLFVRHFRPAVGSHLLELPRGFGDTPPPEAAADADATARWNAERELREETGYPALSSRILGRYVTDSSLLPGEVAVVAIDIDPATVPGRRDGEVDECVWVPRTEIPGRIAAGEFRDAHTLSALALALAENAGPAGTSRSDAIAAAPRRQGASGGSSSPGTPERAQEARLSRYVP